MRLRALLSIIDSMSDNVSSIDLIWGHYDRGGTKIIIKNSLRKNRENDIILSEIQKRIETESKNETKLKSEEMVLFHLEENNTKGYYLSLKACDLNRNRIFFLILPIILPNIAMLLEILFLFQYAMDNTVDLCCLIDSQGNITRISRRGSELLDVDPKDLQGANLNDYLVSPRDIDSINKLSRHNDHTEIYLKTKSGKEILCLGSIVPYYDMQGELQYYFLTVTDISHQLLLYSNSVMNNMELSDKNELLLRSQAVLLKTEKLASIGMLGSGLAHEINNPLSFLMNDIELLKEFYDNFSAYNEKIMLNDNQSHNKSLNKRYEIDYWLSELPIILSEMKEGMDRIAKIIHSLKSFSGIDKSDVWSFYNINDTLDEMLLISLNEYKYTLDVKLLKGDLPLVYCHIKEINQAFLSVFMNCIHAIEEWGEGNPKKEKGLVTIKTDYIKKTEEVRITFSDNGIPFPSDLEKSMADPFYSGWTNRGSSGMGLAIVNDIISLKHKGNVDFIRGKEKQVILTFPVNNNIGEE